MKNANHSSSVGRKFGSWLVLSVDTHRGRKLYNVRCDCGALARVEAHSVLDGRSTRCRSCARPHCGRVTHGATVARKATPEFTSWRAMMERCSNPRHRNWQRYGGRGISVCKRWLEFKNFLADMGERRPGTTLDRINSAGNYEPENCRWATAAEQSRNRHTTRRITIAGLTLCADEWGSRNGIPAATIYDRLRRGWDPARAVTEPSHQRSARLHEDCKEPSA